MSAFQTATPFAVFMFLQGLVQGGGWPACAKILKQVRAFVVLFSRQNCGHEDMVGTRLFLESFLILMSDFRVVLIRTFF